MKYLIQRTQTYSGDTLWPNLPENKKKISNKFLFKISSQMSFLQWEIPAK
jgi:hypothetical protein